MPSLITRGAMSVKALGFGASANTLSFLGYFTSAGSPLIFSVGTSGGEMYFTGNNASLSNFVKLSTSGTVSWSKYVSTTAAFNNGTDLPPAVSMDSTGNMYIPGSASSAPAGGRLLKLDSLGAFSAGRSFTDSGYSVSAGVTYIDVSDNIYVAYDTINSSTSYSETIIVKMNSSLTVQWQRRLYDNTTGVERPTGIFVDGSGNVFVSTDITNIVGTQGAVAKYNSSGTFQWQIKTAANADVRDLLTDSSGNVYFCGRASSKAYIFKVDTSGTKVWSRTLNSASTEYHTSMAVDQNNYIYVAGHSSATGAPIVVAKYNTAGTIQWQRQISIGSGNLGNGCSISVDSSGFMYITSGAATSFFAKLPTDGSLTGTYTAGSRTYTYAASTRTDVSSSDAVSAASGSSATSTFTSASSTITISNLTALTQNLKVI